MCIFLFFYSRCISQDICTIFLFYFLHSLNKYILCILFSVRSKSLIDQRIWKMLQWQLLYKYLYLKNMQSYHEFRLLSETCKLFTKFLMTKIKSSVISSQSSSVHCSRINMKWKVGTKMKFAEKCNDYHLHTNTQKFF